MNLKGNARQLHTCVHKHIQAVSNLPFAYTETLSQASLSFFLWLKPAPKKNGFELLEKVNCSLETDKVRRRHNIWDVACSLTRSSLLERNLSICYTVNGVYSIMGQVTVQKGTGCWVLSNGKASVSYCHASENMLWKKSTEEAEWIMWNTSDFAHEAENWALWLYFRWSVGTAQTVTSKPVKLRWKCPAESNCRPHLLSKVNAIL